MATKVSTKTTFEVARSIEPIYTGGEVSANATGTLLATSVDDDILVVNVKSGKPLIRIDGDGETITSLCLSPTAAHLVVCSRSLSMKTFALTFNGDSLSAELLRTSKPHTSPVVSSCIDTTGSLLVTGGADGTAKVWDIRGGYCSHTFHGHGGLVTAVELFEATRPNQSISKKRKSRDGDHDMTDLPAILLASGGEDGKIKIWDLNTRKNLATLDSHVSVVRSIKYSSDQERLISVSRDRTVVIWDTKTWTSQRIIPVLESLEAGGFIADGSYCFTGGENGRLRLFSTDTGKEVTESQQPGLENESIVHIVRIPSENSLLTIHQDQTMVMQSYESLQTANAVKSIPPLPVIRRISGNHDEIIDMACVGPDRSQLALATNTESIRIISINDINNEEASSSFGGDVALLEGHQDIIICLDTDWSGYWLATGAKDNTARLWRLDPASSTYECFATFSGHAESLGAVALPRAPQSGTANARDPLNHPPPYLITGSQDKTIKKWDTSKLSLLDGEEPHDVAKAMFTRVAHEKDINALDVSSIAPLFASASQDKNIKIWSVDDGSTTGILRGHKRGVWSIKFSPANTPALHLADGGTSSSRGLLVSGSGDRTVKIWSLANYTCLLTFEGHSNSVLKVIWLPPPGSNEDSETSNQRDQPQPMIASASSDTLVKLWSPYASADSDHLLATLDNHTDRVWSLTSPTTTNNTSLKSKRPFTFISGAADATISFWNDTTTATALASSKHLTERIEQDQLLQNHIRARNYRESITLALTLNHPGRLLAILSQVVNLPEAEKEPNTIMGKKAVDDVLATLSQQELYTLLERVRDWNTNARTATVAQRILHVVLRRYPPTLWEEMAKHQRKFRSSVESSGLKGARQTMGMKDLFRALEVYTERHYKRMEELVDESYLIEYTLREMDEVAGTVQASPSINGANGIANGVSRVLTNGTADSDVLMA